MHQHFLKLSPRESLISPKREKVCQGGALKDPRYLEGFSSLSRLTADGTWNLLPAPWQHQTHSVIRTSCLLWECPSESASSAFRFQRGNQAHRWTVADQGHSTISHQHWNSGVLIQGQHFGGLLLFSPFNSATEIKVQLSFISSNPTPNHSNSS